MPDEPQAPSGAAPVKSKMDPARKITLARLISNKRTGSGRKNVAYFKVGGKGKLLIPSHLGYGRYGNNEIPGGSVLIFEVNLKSINN